MNDNYEVHMIPTDDYGLFKNDILIKVFCSRNEAYEELERVKND